MIIDHTYFINEIAIPNKEQQPTLGLINGFIQKYEPEFLEKVFGYSFAKELTEGLAMLPTPAQKWLDILNGAEYTDTRSKTQKWKGLRSGSGVTDKQSIIANYVFYWYQRHAFTQNTSSGEVKTDVENARMVATMNKAILSYNQLYDSVSKLYCFLNSKTDVYTTWETNRGIQYCSLRYFLSINELNV